MSLLPPSPHRRRALRLLRIRRRLNLIPSGGSWSAALPAAVRTRLRWFWYDGALALGADSISTTYLALYAVALGASSAQVGLLSAVGSLSAAAMLLPGAFLVERLGRRHRIALLAGIGMRASLLLMALIPLGLQGAPAIAGLLVLAILSQGSGNLGYPAWVSLTADIVPLEHRGRYFGARNIANTVVSMIAAYAAGLIITRNGIPGGYQLAFLLAFLFGVGSSISFSRIQDPAPAVFPPSAAGEGLLQTLRTVLQHRSFMTFCAVVALWNLALNVAGPFFNIYLVKDLQASAAQVGIITGVTSLVGLPALRLFGPLADRWGPRRLVMATGLLIPILPFAWIFATSPWHVFLINIGSGILWSGYNLAIFNLLLIATPAAHRARFSAVFQIVIALSLAAGAGIGGWVITDLGFKAAFALSGIGRLAAAVLFARLVKESTTAQQSARSLEA
jgi:MFS family permease